jgi:Protein of unknown function (DUF3995)
MIEFISVAVLVALAALHAYWGVGGHWPGRDDLSLGRTVAGFRGVSKMPPPLACYAVAAVLVCAALWTLMLAGRLNFGLPRPLLILGGVALALVFLGRGVAAYLPAWRKLAPEQPFAYLDQILYGPLCLTLGTLLGIVASKGFG